MSNGWDAFSRVAINIEQRDLSAREEGGVARLLEQIAYLHCERLNQLAAYSQLQDAYSELNSRHELLCALIATEEGESGRDDSGDYYVAPTATFSRRTH